MSLSSEGIHNPQPVATDPPQPVHGGAELDLRATSTNQLVITANLLQEEIRSANIFDPEVPDLIRREYGIRQELGRRDVLLMQSVVWATAESKEIPLRPPEPTLVNTIKTRNGRGGPGGPGDWDD